MKNDVARLNFAPAKKLSRRKSTGRKVFTETMSVCCVKFEEGKYGRRQ